MSATAHALNTVHIKDPEAVKDYAWDWSGFLGVDTIVSQQVLTSVPAGLTVGTVTGTTTTVTAWLSGGTAGASQVTCRIVTAGGRTDDCTKTIVIREQ